MGLRVNYIEEWHGRNNGDERIIIRKETRNTGVIIESTLDGPCSFLEGSYQIIGEVGIMRGVPRVINVLSDSFGATIGTQRIHAVMQKTIGIDLPDTERQIQIEVEGE